LFSCSVLLPSHHVPTLLSCFPSPLFCSSSILNT
jgi:hypothetical protein